MKTKILLYALLMTLSTQLHAAIITVVNGDNLQTKINGATAGDILIVGPGTYTGNYEINKKLTLFGPGYHRSSGGDAVITGYVWFQNGTSDGSYFSGFLSM
jgi:nitrous oxidase accessory protein NosD